VTPGRPTGDTLGSAELARDISARCPTDALAAEGARISVDYRHCVACGRCRERRDKAGTSWVDDFEWAATAAANDEITAFHRAFGRSLHVRFIDAGACGACVGEVRQLNSPYYNLHRLGFFLTPTPRNADVLLVSGPVSDAMRGPLVKTYQAMPEPKRVVAIGVCAISGGVFGPSFAVAGGVGEVIPVDLVIPGCPPPPLAILHGLLAVVGRRPTASLIDDGTAREEARRT
jgi:Ni,Fe-hydrogenase III small subunit